MAHTALPSRLRRRISCRRDDGAALVEFALVVPLLSILAFGAIEFGFLFSHGMDLKTANRAGARLAATTGNPVIHDFEILQTIKNSRGAIPVGDISKVIIYKASNSSGAVPGPCKTVVGGNSGLNCNVYTNADLQAMSPTGIALYEKGWPAADRQTGMDIGIYIESRRTSVTGLFGNGFNVSDQVVLRVEPAASPDATFTLPTSPPPPTTTTTTIPPPTTTTVPPPTTTPPPPTSTSSTIAVTTPPTIPKPTTTTQPPPTTVFVPTTTTIPISDG